MKLLFAFLFALMLPVSAVAADASAQPIDSAKAWLALVDAGNYGQSWSEASTLFKSHMAEAQWAKAAKGDRNSMGAAVSRNVDGAKFGTTLPGAPDGRYAVVRFHTKFTKKAGAVETVILKMEGGAWKTVSYIIT